MKMAVALLTTAAELLRPAGNRGRIPPEPMTTLATAPTEPPERPVGDPTALEPSIYRFILRYSLRQQIILLLLTLASFPFLYYSLELPKLITNRAIAKHHFPQYLFGFAFDQIPYL